MLSGRGLCNELITCPEESYRLWCVVCDLENFVNEEAMTRVGSQGYRKKGYYFNASDHREICAYFMMMTTGLITITM